MRSRSNPTEGTPNPSTRWFTWSGEAGCVRYYDKQTEKRVDVAGDFTFLLLAQLGCVRGWHDNSQSGIYSNEVEDTRQDTLVVKAFKGGIIAEGIYRDIKDRVNAQGGRFHTSCYIAFKGDNGLALGNLQLKGAALRSWMEFTKANRATLFDKAIRIAGFTEDKKGRITFRLPNLKLTETTEATQKLAVSLDVALQAYLASYLARNKRDQVEHAAPHLRDEDVMPEDDHGGGAMPDDSDIPFARMESY